MCTLHSPTAPFPHRQGHNRVLCALPKTVCVLKHNASNPFYTMGSVPCVLFLVVLCPLTYLQDRVPYQYPGSFPAVHGLCSIHCVFSVPARPQSMGRLGGFQSFAPTDNCGVDLAFGHM